MKITTVTLERHTKGFDDVQDLTEDVQRALTGSGCANGLLTVFVPGSTAGITTIENETGAVADLKNAIERLAPRDIYYQHDARWGDGNGFSHVRAALIGPSLTIPFVKNKLQLGTWQQILLLDFDNQPRVRRILIQILGE